MKKLIYPLLFLFAILILCSCDITPPTIDGGESEEHNLTEFRFDDYGHYYDCDDPDCTEKHEFEEHDSEAGWVLIKENTHSEAGYYEFSCDGCDAVYKRYIEKGHNYELVAEQPPTCVSLGYKKHYECKECGQLAAVPSRNDPYQKYVEVTKAELAIAKTGHDFKNATLVYDVPTPSADGGVSVRCKKCNANISGKEGYDIPLSHLDVNFYTVTTLTEASCTAEGVKSAVLKKQMVRYKLWDYTAEYDYYIDEFTKLGVFEPFEIRTDKLPHEYEGRIIIPKHNQPGYVYVACVCGSLIAPLGIDTPTYYDVELPAYDADNPLYNEYSNTLTCLNAYGSVKYRLNSYLVKQLLSENYGFDEDELTAYTADLCPQGYSFSYQLTEHKLKTHYTAPTLDSTGALVIKCEVCNQYKYDGRLISEPFGAVIPKLSRDSEYYRVESVSAHCESDGLITFSYNKELFIDWYMNREYFFKLTANEIEEFCAFLDSNPTSTLTRTGHSYSAELIELVLPTYDTDGAIKYKCKNESCSHYLTDANGNDALILPKISDLPDFYCVEYTEYLCKQSANMTVSTDPDSFANYCHDFDSVCYSLRNSEALAPLKNGFEVSAALSTHFADSLIYAYEVVPGDNENQFSVIKCDNCKEVLATVELPPASDPSLYKSAYEGNCQFNASDSYYMKEEDWLERINGNTELINNLYTDYAEIADILASRQVYYIVGEKNPNKHIELVYPDGFEYMLPELTATGYAISDCTMCGGTHTRTIEYTEGEWEQVSTGSYRRKYFIGHGTYVFDAPIEYWHVTIVYPNDVTMTSNTSLLDARYDIDGGAERIQLESTYFRRNGEFVKFESIEFYLDGVRKTEDELVEEGRLTRYTTDEEISVMVARTASLSASGKSLIGNLEIRITFTE